MALQPESHISAWHPSQKGALPHRPHLSFTLGLMYSMLLLAAMFPANLSAADSTSDDIAPVKAVKLNEAKITLIVGQTKQVITQVEPADLPAQTLRYESGNTGFFTVDAKGTLTGIHEGVSVLAVIAPNGVRAEATVTVQAKENASEKTAATNEPTSAEQGILIGNEGGEIEVGRYERVIAHVLPFQVIGTNPFNLTSSDPSVIAVLNPAKTIQAIKPGTATITVTTLDKKYQDTVTYTVVAPETIDRTQKKTYTLEPDRFDIKYDDSSEAAAKANSAGLHNAMRHTAENGFTRLLLQPNRVLYIEPTDTIHMVSNVQLDLNGSEIRLRPNAAARYVAFMFSEKDKSRILENASIVNGTLTGERDQKETVFPNWQRTPATEGGCTIVFDEGRNNGIENLTVRKSIGFNISSGLGSTSHGVQHFPQSPVSVSNMEEGGFDSQGNPQQAQGQIRTIKPIDITKFQTPHYDIGYPLGYMGYPYVNSRIYDVYFYDKDMQLLSSARGQLRFRQYTLPQGTAYLHLAFYLAKVPAHGNSDFGNAFAFVENRAMPIHNYIINCVIEDNFSCGFAACGGQDWLIKGNTFRRNGGRMPGCDIDWEDGWEYMQGDLIEDNAFESRLNVISCAGVGMVFRNNTFRGDSTFYGRSQHYSLIGNTFEKAGTDQAFPVKLSLSSQTDIYTYKNQYKGAAMNYTRLHSKAPYVGTYEATLTEDTFDNTQLLHGSISTIANCSFTNGENWPVISAELIDHCTIKDGKYTVRGQIRNCVIENTSLRVLDGEALQIDRSTLKNTTISASASNQGATLDNCNITVDKNEVLLTPNHLPSFTLRNSKLTILKGALPFTLAGGWNATGANTDITLDRVRISVPSKFEGYLHKFSWYPDASDANHITYNITNSNVSMFQRTDEKGEKSNAVFNIKLR